jgi:hypothetical protein
MSGIIVTIGAGWIMWVIVSPNVKLDSEDVKPLNPAIESTYAVLNSQLIQADLRLVPMRGNNLEIYMTTAEFESVPYPDRGEFVDRVANAWCDRVDGIFLPSVKVRDIKLGEQLASRNCFFHSQQQAKYSQTAPATSGESPEVREKANRDASEASCVYRFRQKGIDYVEGKSVEAACKENPDRQQ